MTSQTVNLTEVAMCNTMHIIYTENDFPTFQTYSKWEAMTDLVVIIISLSTDINQFATKYFNIIDTSFMS